MPRIKENDIYPKFEFRLTHQEKAWLQKELRELKGKFSEHDFSLTKNTLVMAALRHGLRYLRSRQRLKLSASAKRSAEPGPNSKKRAGSMSSTSPIKGEVFQSTKSKRA